MYVPPANRQDDPQELHALMRAFPFATLVTVAGAEPIVSHVPLMLEERDGRLVLHGHLARANPHWQAHAETARALAIFTAADAYISPSWYEAKREHGRVVPTWNYRVVHARGTLQFFHDAPRLAALVAALTDAHEATFDQPWAAGDAPADYLEKQYRGIVGFELEITSLEGKWKLSQNRSDADRHGTIAGLRARDEANAHAVADDMERTFEPGDSCES